MEGLIVGTLLSPLRGSHHRKGRLCLPGLSVTQEAAEKSSSNIGELCGHLVEFLAREAGETKQVGIVRLEASASGALDECQVGAPPWDTGGVSGSEGKYVLEGRGQWK